MAFLIFPCAVASAQSPSDTNPALNAPDEVAWKLFIEVNSRAGGSNSVFETYASDTDTFNPTPRYPEAATPLALHPPILRTVAAQFAKQRGVLLPALPPNTALGSEETRRNRAAFQFIVSNNLYKISGLKAAFGKTLSFPEDSIEVKANWLPVDEIPKLTNNAVTLENIAKFYHVNTDTHGDKFALLSMHVISKLVPNWTWATFENRFNPGRCDVMGCRDSFGATTPIVPPQTKAGQIYPDCVKTKALGDLFAKADIEPAYASYCLKGSQTDFTDNTGLAVRLGNSVTEAGFVPTSSCITCHSRAAFDSAGNSTSSAGFLPSGDGPLGPMLPEWYWVNTGKPPVYEGKPGLKRRGTSADFVWSIPLCAIDDTKSPPPPSLCTLAGK